MADGATPDPGLARARVRVDPLDLVVVGIRHVDRAVVPGYPNRVLEAHVRRTHAMSRAPFPRHKIKITLLENLAKDMADKLRLSNQWIAALA